MHVPESSCALTRLQCVTVYGFDWSNRALWTTEREPRDHVPSQVDRAAVERTLLLHWQEHCIECAPPDCYGVCPLTSPAPIGSAPASSTGSSRTRPTRGCSTSAPTSLSPLGGVEAQVGGPSVTPDAHRRLARADRGITAAVDGVSRALARVSPQRRLSGADAVVRDRLLLRTPGSRALNFDAFVLECHAPDEEPFRLVLEWAPHGPTAFRQVLEIEPGPNLHVLPAEVFGPLDDAEGGRILLYPEEDAERRIVFTWLDFVRYRERPAATVGAGRPAHLVKCLAWDLDNTLWDGTLLEDGPDGCRLRPEAARLVRKLDERGILQTIVSKNDHHEAWALVERFDLAEAFCTRRSAGVARATACAGSPRG